MRSRQFAQNILGLVFAATSSLALSNTQFTYVSNSDSIEILGCENICPLNLIIPNEIDGLPVTKIGWAAFHNNHLTSVFIPNSVTTIDNQAFGKNNLSSVVIPESVSTIGWLAFDDNNLEAVSLPSSLERIEAGVFKGNQLTDIVIPENVTFIGTDAFRENEINSVTLSNNLMLISTDAFSGNNISNLTIPSSVVSIDERAFFQNPLEKVTFLGDRPNIGKDVFSLVQERDNSFWENLVYENCSSFGWPGVTDQYINNNPDEFCDATTHNYEHYDSEVVLSYCENNNDWPGDALFISEYKSIVRENDCDDSTPGFCYEYWVKEISSPQLIENCPINIASSVNPVVNYSIVDMDQNGTVDALTDGLIILRYFFGLRGDSLINGAMASDATRSTAEEIEAHMQSLLP